MVISAYPVGVILAFLAVSPVATPVRMHSRDAGDVETRKIGNDHEAAATFTGATLAARAVDELLESRAPPSKKKEKHGKPQKRSLPSLADRQATHAVVFPGMIGAGSGVGKTHHATSIYAGPFQIREMDAKLRVRAAALILRTLDSDELVSRDVELNEFN